MKKILCLGILFFYSFYGIAQTISPDILSKKWNAWWITAAGASKEYGVYHFRKTFSLTHKPDSFIINVSADNRYKLFVNGVLVSLGPARGDLFHWNFETTDIAAYLNSGNNVIATVVWNFGDYKPEHQLSFRTGFILQGNSDREQAINSNSSWKCTRDS